MGKKTDNTKKELVKYDIEDGVPVRRILEKRHVSYSTYKKALNEYNYENRPYPKEIKEYKQRRKNIISAKVAGEISDTGVKDRMDDLQEKHGLSMADLDDDNFMKVMKRRDAFRKASCKKQYKREPIPRIKKERERKKKEAQTLNKRKEESKNRIKKYQEKKKKGKFGKKRSESNSNQRKNVQKRSRKTIKKVKKNNPQLQRNQNQPGINWFKK